MQPCMSCLIVRYSERRIHYGRTQEVASVTHYLNDNYTVNLPPFVTHCLDEVGVCIVPFVQ